MPVPSLDALAADPAQAAALPPEVAQALWTRCVLVQAALLPRLTALNGAGASEAAEADRLLTVEEAARTLGVSEDWLYRRAARLPFTVRMGRSVRFSALGLARYIRSRAGR